MKNITFNIIKRIINIMVINEKIINIEIKYIILKRN